MGAFSPHFTHLFLLFYQPVLHRETSLALSRGTHTTTVHLNSRFVFALNREAAFGGRASLFVACRMTSFPKTQQTFCNINAGGTLCVETTAKNTTTARSIFRRKERGRRRTRRLGAAAARKSRSTKSDDAYAREEDSLKRSTQNTTTTTLTTQKKKTKTTKTKKSEEKATRRDFAMKTTILLSSSTFLDAGDARADDNNAFVVFAERIRANNAASSSSSSSSDTSLENKIAHPKLFKKRVINKSKPGATKYPLFLLGEWGRRSLVRRVRVPVGRVYRSENARTSSHVSRISKVERRVFTGRGQDAGAEISGEVCARKAGGERERGERRCRGR